jgi:hypothetical protein
VVALSVCCMQNANFDRIGVLHRVDAERGVSLKPTGFGCGAGLLDYPMLRSRR